MRRSTKWTGIMLAILIMGTVMIWYAALREDRAGKLTVSFLNIGQGDAIFIEAPSGRQVLIDGGPDTSVIRELSRVMPWYDRSIDVVIGTHPDSDHIGGLIDVLPRYRVGLIVQSSVQGNTATWNTFEKEIQKDAQKGAKVLTATRGEVIDLGGAPGRPTAYLEVLSPDRSVPHIETNTGCVVARLVYGDTAFMLSCDAPKAIENYLVALDPASLKANVLKAGHHGSKNSSSPLFIGTVDPQYAVYSRGCNNKYGHPNQETIDTFARFSIPTFDTCKQGTITFVSDGKNIDLIK